MHGCFYMAAAVVMLVACGGDGSQRQVVAAQGFQPGQPGQASYAAAPAAPQAAPSSGPAAQAGVQPLGNVSNDASALQSIIAGALAGGAASLSALTGGELGPIEQGIKLQSQSHARGMKPDGQLMTAKLAQGGHAQGTLLMQSNTCYTVLGFAGLGVFKYQINLITAPPAPPSVLAQSTAEGVTPVVGANAQCLKNPYPLPMQVK
ncbi:MAG TPA: hypothetical protein VK524_34795, partial [Polyangiaceae bacterium]|nr:hypothetical protein [Polyangiaceae bacterium]